MEGRRQRGDGPSYPSCKNVETPELMQLRRLEEIIIIITKIDVLLISYLFLLLPFWPVFADELA